MHVVQLSDHPGDLLDDASRRRAAAEKQALAAYEDALIRYRARVQMLRVKRDRARAGHRWWAWLRLAVAGWRDKRGVPRPPVPSAGHTDTEERLMAGIAGEQQVAAELGRALDDDWTLVRGYRNRRGEIDQLLLGPHGLFAIEVKNLNATVHVDGDRWRADKYDHYGNLVEQRPIADRKGRSPSAQLDERRRPGAAPARRWPAGRDPARRHPGPPPVPDRHHQEPDGPGRHDRRLPADPDRQPVRPGPAHRRAAPRHPPPDRARPRPARQAPPRSAPPRSAPPAISPAAISPAAISPSAAISLAAASPAALGPIDPAAPGSLVHRVG